MFEHCDALRPLSFKYNELFEDFRSWKGTIPTAGARNHTDIMVIVMLSRGSSVARPVSKYFHFFIIQHTYCRRYLVIKMLLITRVDKK